MAALPAGMEFAQPFLNRLDGMVAGNAYVNEAAARTGVPRPFVALAIVLVIMAFVFFGMGASLVATLIGTAYPAYMSFIALETPDKADDVQWLTYWVVFSVFSLLETVSDTLLFWFPFYYTVKVIFLLYCQSPYTRGAEVIYRNFLRGQFIRYRPFIDATLGRVWGMSNAVVDQARGAGAEALAAAAVGGLAQRGGLVGAGAKPIDPRSIFGTGPVAGNGFANGAAGSVAGGAGAQRSGPVGAEGKDA